MAEVRSRDLIAALDEASLSTFHLPGGAGVMDGFFTDAYDLFVIGIASALITKDWTLSSGRLALAQLHDAGRRLPRRVHVRPLRQPGWPQARVLDSRRDHDRQRAGVGAATLVLGADRIRFLLGFGAGGDYPVSAVLMSEYANRKDRAKLVGMVLGTQALGLIVGPLIALSLLGAGATNDV